MLSGHGKQSALETHRHTDTQTQTDRHRRRHKRRHADTHTDIHTHRQTNTLLPHHLITPKSPTWRDVNRHDLPLVALEDLERRTARCRPHLGRLVIRRRHEKVARLVVTHSAHEVCVRRQRVGAALLAKIPDADLQRQAAANKESNSPRWRV